MAFPARIEATLSLARLIHPPKDGEPDFLLSIYLNQVKMDLSVYARGEKSDAWSMAHCARVRALWPVNCSTVGSTTSGTVTVSDQ
jgi:hypothetical protein